jgi:hypothetical protein
VSSDVFYDPLFEERWHRQHPALDCPHLTLECTHGHERVTWAPPHDCTEQDHQCWMCGAEGVTVALAADERHCWGGSTCPNQ